MGLQVIGAGMGRTGTESLRRALEMLGLGPCHHMFALRDDPTLVPPWLAVAREEVAPDWDALFEGFRAQVDWPGAAYWRETAAYFPDARVILSTRDADEWHASLAATILPFVAARGRHHPPHRNDMAELTERILARELGDPANPARAKAAFEAHDRRVRDTIAPERLLVYPVGAGWSPLCAFLGIARPRRALPLGQHRRRVPRPGRARPGSGRRRGAVSARGSGRGRAGGRLAGARGRPGRRGIGAGRGVGPRPDRPRAHDDPRSRGRPAPVGGHDGGVHRVRSPGASRSGLRPQPGAWDPPRLP